MDDRVLDLTEAQEAVKSKYPPINKKYEYLDHTADVQIHSWGDSLEEAFEQCAMGMFGYMTDTETVEPIDTVEVESEGEDMESLLFHFLDDWLYKFSADLFFIPRLFTGALNVRSKEWSTHVKEAILVWKKKKKQPKKEMEKNFKWSNQQCGHSVK
uniref:Protein archease n=1 Tax=Astatotilapia calliptera TaxID=8154 RepID=A0A3P8NMY7_ASTCA